MIEEVRWDAAYDQGKYQGADAAPVDFVAEIAAEAQKLGDHAVGLYVGCGNGRNLLPLIDAGLDLTGVDISQAALDQIADQRPELTPKLVHGDMLEIGANRSFDYLVALQVFQHTDQNSHRHEDMFERARDLLRDDGLLFLRVNSTSTQIAHKFTVNSEREDGGFTVRYLSGPKKDMFIHFYTEQELARTAAENLFKVVKYPVEKTMVRKNGTTWSQWETIWRAI